MYLVPAKSIAASLVYVLEPSYILLLNPNNHPNDFIGGALLSIKLPTSGDYTPIVESLAGGLIAANDGTYIDEGRLGATLMRESGDGTNVPLPNNVMMYNPNSTPKEITYSNDIPLHLNIIDASLNIHDSNFNVLDTSTNIIDSSLNILDNSFNLQKTIVDASLNIVDASFSIIDTSLNVHDVSLNTLDTQVTNLISQGGGGASFGSTIAIGSGSTAIGTNSVAIGNNASTSTYDNSVAFGNGSTAGADNAIILGNGTQNVGIGISNPLYGLDVDGEIYARGDGSSSTRLGSYNNASWLWVDSLNGTESDLRFGSTTTSGTLGTEIMRLKATGSVGIGTTNPLQKLHVESGNIIAYSNQHGVELAQHEIKMTRSGAAHWSLFNTGYFKITNTSNNNNAGTNGTDYFTMDTAGKVGIGTDDPQKTLHTLTSADIVAQFESSDAGARILIKDTTTSGYINASSSKVSIGQTDGLSANNLNIDASGNVGIGTTAPTKSLHLNFNNTNTAKTTGNGFAGGVAGDGLLIQNSNTANNTYANLDFRAGTADARIVYQYTGTTNQGDFHFITDNTNSPATAMTIKNDGKVGIGDTTPSYKLDVNGTFRTTGNGYFDGSNINFTAAGANIKFNGGGGYISTTTAHALRLQTNNTEALRLTSGQDAVFAGTISSGAITSSGKVKGASLETDRYIYHAGDTNTYIDFGTDEINFHAGGGANQERLIISSSQTNVASGNFQVGGFTVITSARNMQNIGNINIGGYYAMDGVTIIDTSKNLTNIGTISSGDITISGDFPRLA